FEIGFSFESARGDEKHRLVSNLGLSELADRLSSGVDRKGIGLGADLCLEQLKDDDAELPYLVIEEQGTTGMYGPWRGNMSKLYLGMVSVGYTRNQNGSGGSFGYGKAGMTRSSATRTVVAYTCFSERDDDPGVTRRLLGMTYWGQHELDGESFTGFARFGKQTAPDVVTPFENEEADEVAQSLGLKLRHPGVERKLGTTFLLIQPTADPNDLITAIERSWWPALSDHSLGFHAYVTKEGVRYYPRPRKDGVLRSFIRAYEVATSADVVTSSEKKVPLRKRGPFPKPGVLGMVSDIEGWSYAGSAQEQRIDHRSMVALIRRPRMVVEYLPVGRTPPFVRGAFVADDRVNDLLRSTEPKAHDAWQTKATDDHVDPEAVMLADRIQRSIRSHASRFRHALKPPERPPEKIELVHFDRLMSKLISGRGPGVISPPTEPRPVTIRLEDRRLVPEGNNSIRVKGSASFALSDHYDGDRARVEVAIRYRYVEDERAGEVGEIKVEGPEGFVKEEGRPGVFTGTLSRDSQSVFRYTTGPYRAEWSGRLYAEAMILEDIHQ
ncbi:MAG: hypothetical protein OXH26_10730, partial [bacterium]|nr:hypothetical protein [bacterium]